MLEVFYTSKARLPSGRIVNNLPVLGESYKVEKAVVLKNMVFFVIEGFTTPFHSDCFTVADEVNRSVNNLLEELNF